MSKAEIDALMRRTNERSDAVNAFIEENFGPECYDDYFFSAKLSLALYDVTTALREIVDLLHRHQPEWYDVPTQNRMVHALRRVKQEASDGAATT